jgi:hypothetical protein
MVFNTLWDAAAFLVNPFAALGEDASTVIDESQSEHAAKMQGFCLNASPLIWSATL